MTATDYDIWLFSNDGNEPAFCLHCEARIEHCLCYEDDDLQQQLTELSSQHEASTAYMRRMNESKN